MPKSLRGAGKNTLSGYIGIGKETAFGIPVPKSFYEDDFLLDTIKNRHAIIRGIYIKIRQKEPGRKIGDIVSELKKKSGYAQSQIYWIINNQ